MQEFAIHSLDDPRIDAYRHLKQQAVSERDRHLVVAEGERLVRRLARSSWKLESVLCTPALRDRIGDQLPERVAVYIAESPIISQIVGFPFHRGVLAAAVPPLQHGLAETLEFDNAATDRLRRSLVVLCPKITDPENLGPIVRSAAAFGALCVVAGREGTNPHSRRMMRTSMGALLDVPIIQTDCWTTAIETLHRHGYETVAAVLDSTAESLAGAPQPWRTALLLGNEHSGVSAELAAECRRRVRIPMADRLISLNVAVAAGILLHHFSASGSSSMIRER